MHTNIHVTILCPGPVFSNFLKESFTARPGEVIYLKNIFILGFIQFNILLNNL